MALIQLNNSGRKVFIQALVYIHDHLSNKISLAEVALHCSVSKSYLCQRFHTSTGIQFVAYLNHIRVNTACEYLVNTQLSIADISYSLGFSSQSYFNKVFKKQMGVTPYRFRFFSQEKANNTN